MLVFVSCVVIATSTLAAGHTPYTGIQANRHPANYAPSGAVYPIDYNDDVNINPMVKSGNLIYSFEQLRRDQPPQVENREEALSKYMYRRPKGTTTTMRVPEIVPAMDDYPVQVPDSSQINRQDRYPTVNTWEQMPVMRPRTSTTLPPALTSFNDFSLDIPTDEIKPEARYPPVQKWPSREMSPPPPPPSPKWEEISEEYVPQPRDSLRQNPAWNYETQPISVPEPRVQSYQSRAEEDSFTPQPHWTEIEARARAQSKPSRQAQAPRAGNRGTHKFNDFIMNAPTSPAPTPARMPAASAPAAQRKSPPPPLPTLTPWSGDNFGK